MKILVVSDEESPYFWDHYLPGRLAEFDLILSCGDLNPQYLSFLVTMARCPVLYVHGNHDGCYFTNPPEGCDCIDGELVEYRGIRILGLGGCRRYHPGPFQYSERQMRRRIHRLHLALWRSKGVDIVVTHAPLRNIGDGEDLAHRGFEAFRELLERYQPKYLLHGHVHLRYGQGTREHQFGNCRIINACERYVLEVEDGQYPPAMHNQLIWKTRHREPYPAE